MEKTGTILQSESISRRGSQFFQDKGIIKTAGAEMQFVPAFWYSPELTTESWLLPKTRSEIIKWPVCENQLIFCNNNIISIKEVKIEDYILDSNGGYQKVLDILKKDADSSTIKITARFAPSAYVADYHPILAIKCKLNYKNNKERTYRDALMYGFINAKEKLQYVSASLLEIGDFVAVPKFKVISDICIDLSEYISKSKTKYKIQISKDEINLSFGRIKYSIPRFLPLKEDLFEVLGWYVAEGHIHNNSVNITMSKDEKDKIWWITDILYKTLNIPKEKMSIDIHNNNYRLIIYSSIFAEFLKQSFNTGAREKDIPKWLLEAPENLIKAFLKGWICGDGSIRQNSFSVNTVSKNLAYKGYLLFNKIGILVWFSEKKQNIDYINKYLKQKVKTVADYSYNLGASGERINKLFPDLHMKDNETRYFEDEQFYYIPISKIEKFITKNKFYCLTTEDHTINIPFVTHNCRIFYNLEPIIRTAIDMHALYPFSKFDLVTPDNSITEFYQDMSFNENFDLYRFILQMSLSFWKFGETIPFLNQVEEGSMFYWKKGILLEPELVELKQVAFEAESFFELIPTEEIKSLVKATDPISVERKKNLPEVVIESVNANQNIPLKAEHVSIVAQITDPSATRGTPIIQNAFKCLIYQDKIRLAQMAIADRYHFPVEMWSIGDIDKKAIPDDNVLNKYRNMINQAIQTPPFSLIVPPIVKYEALGVMGKLLMVKDDYEYIYDQLFFALGVNRSLMMGDGPVFSTRIMSLQKLIMQYKALRDMFENWMIYRYFLPIAKKNNFAITSTQASQMQTAKSPNLMIRIAAKKKYILPQISWYKSLDIEEEDLEKKMYLDLHTKGYVSTKTLYSKFPNLDLEQERKLLEQEKGTVFDKDDRRIPKVFTPFKTEETVPHEVLPLSPMIVPERTETEITPEIKPEEKPAEEVKREVAPEETPPPPVAGV